MEKCLAELFDRSNDLDRPGSEFGQESIKLNLKEIGKNDRDKHLIKQLFEHRSCFLLPPPLEDPSKVRNIHELDEGDLSADFNHGMRNFLQYMSLNINCKKLNKNSMTGNIFQSFLEELVQNFNDREIPMVYDIGSKLFDHEARAILDEMVVSAEEFTEELKEKLPLNEVELHKRFDKYINDTIHQFSLKTEKLSSVHTFATNQECLLK